MVSGFNPNYSAQRLGEIFGKAGEVVRVVIPHKRVAFIKFAKPSIGKKHLKCSMI